MVNVQIINLPLFFLLLLSYLWVVLTITRLFGKSNIFLWFYHILFCILWPFYTKLVFDHFKRLFSWFLFVLLCVFVYAFWIYHILYMMSIGFFGYCNYFDHVVWLFYSKQQIFLFFTIWRICKITVLICVFSTFFLKSNFFWDDSYFVAVTVILQWQCHAAHYILVGFISTGRWLPPL